VGKANQHTRSLKSIRAKDLNIESGERVGLDRGSNTSLGSEHESIRTQTLVTQSKGTRNKLNNTMTYPKARTRKRAPKLHDTQVIKDEETVWD